MTSSGGPDVFACDSELKVGAGGHTRLMVSGGNDKTYKIKNVATGNYLDMYNGFSSENNPVVGWQGSNNISGNQGWHIVVRDTTNHYVTLKNTAGGTYARTPETVAGKGVVGSSTMQQFELIEFETGVYNIKVKGEDLLFNLADSSDGTQVKLKAADDSKNQQWVLILL
ncbi:carbohydrate-binding module family 13 protein [Sphaerobolus stellatus SS14]|uniref:Carbohydrate-binding module family 13 protein n=1 Tax=Sphaerobolus stellatus (strain SS14) TaxID=990650 RepID=A0A0C9UNI6_SPHS4|nr:carbohydrate-binding module family 13 protein [Sphaerobolus stellatus SS14]